MSVDGATKIHEQCKDVRYGEAGLKLILAALGVQMQVAATTEYVGKTAVEHGATHWSMCGITQHNQIGLHGVGPQKSFSTKAYVLPVRLNMFGCSKPYHQTVTWMLAVVDDGEL